MKEKLCIMVQQLNRFGGSEEASTKLANSLAENFDIHIIAVSGRTNIYKLNRAIQVHFLSVDSRMVHFDEYFFKYISNLDIIGCLILTIKFLLFWSLGKWRHKNEATKITKGAIAIISNSIDTQLLAPKKQKTIFYHHHDLDRYKSLLEKFARSISSKPKCYIVGTDVFQKELSTKIKNKIPVIKMLIFYPYSDVFNDKFKGGKIIYSARLEKNNRPHLVPELASKLSSDLHIEMFSIGNLEQDVKNRIAKYNVNEKVTISNSIFNPFFHYSKADILIITSTFASSAATIIEANMFGIPVIALNFGESSSDLIKNDINGIIASDVIEMAAIINELLNNQSRLKKLKNSAYEYSKQFDAENIKQRWIELIKM